MSEPPTRHALRLRRQNAERHAPVFAHHRRNHLRTASASLRPRYRGERDRAGECECSCSKLHGWPFRSTMLLRGRVLCRRPPGRRWRAALAFTADKIGGATRSATACGWCDRWRHRVSMPPAWSRCWIAALPAWTPASTPVSAREPRIFWLHAWRRRIDVGVIRALRRRSAHSRWLDSWRNRRGGAGAGAGVDGTRPAVCEGRPNGGSCWLLLDGLPRDAGGSCFGGCCLGGCCVGGLFGLRRE